MMTTDHKPVTLEQLEKHLTRIEAVTCVLLERLRRMEGRPHEDRDPIPPYK